MTALALAAALAPALAPAPKVVAMSDVKQPAPLVPADCDLRGMPCMLLDTIRLTRSGLVTHATGDEFRAAVLLWCESWSQMPAASLPDDDEELAHLAHVSRTRWKRLRAGALRGWVKCFDGRLYHPVVAEKAREAWESRLAQRRRANKRWSEERDKQAEAAGETRQKPRKTQNKSGKSEKNLPDLSSEPRKIKDLADAAAMPINGKSKVSKNVSSNEDTAADAARGASALPSDHVDDLKKRLFSEGMAILDRLKPSSPYDDHRDLIGALAKHLGGGSEGGARAIQKLRDAEAGVAARTIQGDPARWLWGVVNTAKAAAKKAEADAGSAAVLPGSAAWARKEREERTARARAKNGGTHRDHTNIIDGEAEPVETHG